MKGNKEYRYYVDVMANKRNGTLYIGVTSDLIRRVYDHQNDLLEGFTRKYRIHTGWCTMRRRMASMKPLPGRSSSRDGNVCGRLS